MSLDVSVEKAAATRKRAGDDAVSRAVEGVIAAGRHAGERGWVPATSGNFSVRIDAGQAAMTATGTDKAALTQADVLVAPIEGPPHARASAEGPLHMALYAARPEIGAIFHVHSLCAALAGEIYKKEGRIVIEGAELLKALSGIKTHETRIELPVFPNSQDIPALAEEALPVVLENPAAPGLILAGHGLYAWGRDAGEAKRHLEALDYLLTYTLELKRYAR